MKQVDHLGHYESDDETGFFFEQMKEIQLILDSIIEKEIIAEDFNDPAVTKEDMDVLIGIIKDKNKFKNK